MNLFGDDQAPFHPERLTLARERRGLNKTQLAKMIRKHPRTISDYEAGRTEPAPPVLEALVDALRFPPQFFFRPLTETMHRDAASFRALSKMTAAQAAAALAVGTLGIELNRWVEANFDLPEPDVPDLQPGIVSPEGAASLVRAKWGLGLSPIPNMLHLLERHGVRTFSLADECREVDAFSAWVGDTPYICVATYKTPERAIFDAAHELGHLILHRDHASPRGRREEREADSFASCLLMPRDDVDAAGATNPTFADLVRLKKRWRVSAAALAYRLHHLGYISDWHYRELCIELGAFGRDREPEPVERERSQVLSKVFETMRREGTTANDIAAELDLFVEDLDAVSFGLVMTVLGGGGETTQRRRDHLRLL